MRRMQPGSPWLGSIAHSCAHPSTRRCSAAAHPAAAPGLVCSHFPSCSSPNEATTTTAWLVSPPYLFFFFFKEI